VGGTYREWTHLGKSLTEEQEGVQIAALKMQMETALATSDRVVFAGDINLDTHWKGEYKAYNHCATMEAFFADTVLGYVYTPTVATWVSYRLHGKDKVNRTACIATSTPPASERDPSLSRC
jgi:hypothetical protein